MVSFVERYFTIEQVALLLDLHPNTIRKECARGSLKFIRVGQRGIRVPQSALDEYLTTQHQPTPAA